MKAGFTKALMFTAGAALGGIGTWLTVREYYRQLADDEVQSIREYYTKRDERVRNKLDEFEKTVDRFEAMRENYTHDNSQAYDDMVSGFGYRFENSNAVPYVIDSELCGENDEYEERELIYYADGVLCDEYDMPIEDPDDTVGKAALKALGRHDEDEVYVCDDTRGMYYTILRSEKAYRDVVDDGGGGYSD